MDFPKKRRGDKSQIYRFLFEKDIFMNQKPVKSPTGFEDNLRVLLETLQMQWQRRVCVISKDSTNGFKNCHSKVEYCSLTYLFL